MTNLMPYRFNRTPARRNDYSPLFDEFFRPFFGMESMAESFRVDVKDQGDQYLLEADMPGVKKDQIVVDVDQGVLTISAQMEESKEEKEDSYVCHERRCGSFRRSFTLNGIDENAITAKYDDGVLKLTMPKQKEQPKTGRRIELN